MRICLYTDTALPKMGGQELVVDALARHFGRAGHEAVVLAPQPRGALPGDDRARPYPVLRHPRFFSTRYLVNWYRRWLLRAQQAHQFDVIHCHGVYPPGYLAGLCRARLGLPILITSHGGDVRAGSPRLAKPVVRRRHEEALRSADALIAISRFTRAGFERLGARQQRIVEIPNGVDYTAFAEPAAPCPSPFRPGSYVLFLGRLKRRKGGDVLLEALARCQAARLLIAGEGEEQAALEDQAARLGLGDRVRFVGKVGVPAKAYLLQGALATIMPSRGWEGFPLVVLESYAAGTPVVGSDVPGLADLIQPQQTGLVVRPEDPSDLAGALARIFAAPAWVRHLGQSAQELAAQYRWEEIARRHLALYEELSAAAGARRAG